jgi:phospholipid-transporting ATPase
MAMKLLSEAEYEEFNNKFNNISDDSNREEAIEQLADELERDLTLIGATAVEDKLQRDVPETIADLLKASNGLDVLVDIKVWMLTGDKLETAENIARSCRLIQGDMTVLRLATKDDKEIDLRMSDNE